MIYGPNPDERIINDLLGGPSLAPLGETVERLPVVYEVTVYNDGTGSVDLSIKAFGATADAAEEIAGFARRVSAALYAPEGDGE